jgi:NAD(P)-dependent dehydrogenase (short-subunit alcohol dehydrogenase family)
MTTARTMPENEANPQDFVAADVSTVEGARRLIGGVGAVGILVHVAGGSRAASGGFAALSEEQWQEELDLNLLAAVRLDRGLLPGMLERGNGAIVHVQIDPATDAALRGDARLRSSQGCPDDVQQGLGE